MGKSAFDWDVYKNRKSALQYLKRNKTLVDTILETEDGTAREAVHSQVISAFGEKLNKYINENGRYIVLQNQPLPRPNPAASGGGGPTCNGDKLKLIRLPKVNKYTLGILVECAYTGYIRTDLPSGGIWQVLEVADHYEMLEVIKACCSFLVKNLNKSNCVQFYHIGIRHNNLLMRCAWHKIRANFKHILASNLRRLESSSSSPSSQQWQPLASPQAHQQQQLGPAHPSLIQHPNHLSGQRVASASSRQPQPTSEPANQSQLVPAAAVAATATGGGSDMVTDVTSNQEDLERRLNNLATMKFEHFEALLMHDKLNVDNEESVWYAIRMWCNYKLDERANKIGNLLPCMRFPRFRQGTEFSARFIWRDPLVMDNREAQHQLAVLDRNHRDYLGGTTTSTAHGRASMSPPMRDGFSLPCAPNPRQLRPRIPHSILLAIGGWKQGQPTTLIESYDVNCNLWFETPKRIMSPLAYHGVEYIDGLLYICGGTDGSEILNEVFTFDPVRGDCQQRPSMREARCYVSTAHLSSGHLYAMGGHNGLQRMKSVERFAYAEGSLMWEHVRDMNVARSDASACVHEQLIYIAGGLNDQVIEASVEFYNRQDDTWTFAGSMQTPRTSFTLLLYQSSLLAIGGNNGTERLASVEQYSFASRVWSQHSEMRHRRSTFSAALMDGGTKLIVVGGYNGQTPFNQVEMFDEQARQWVLLQKIRYDRSGLKVVAVNDLPNAIDYTFLGRSAGGSGQPGGQPDGSS